MKVNEYDSRYLEENDILMKSVIDNLIFSDAPQLQHGEFIVRAACNQQCEYCYMKHEGLNPPDANKETILKNMDAMLDYIYFEKRRVVRRWDLFAGDMFFDNLIFDILKHFEICFDKLREKNPSLFLEPFVISFPCNCSFFENEDQTARMKDTIINFYKKNIKISISWSTDGPYAVDVREKRSLPDEYYTRGFEFIQELGYGTHPMVAACSIENAIANYDWWLEKYEEYGLNKRDGNFQPMMLEVRNNDWTEDKIITYLNFLKHMIEKRLEVICNNDFDTFVWTVLGNYKNRFEFPQFKVHPLQNYDPINLRYNERQGQQWKISCAEQQMFHIRLTDLALVPCHRMSYPQFVGGNFILDENNKVIDFKSHNPMVYMATKNLNTKYYPKCFNCLINNICGKGCLGSQFETFGDPFFPIDCVCDLFKNKFKYLITTYGSMGVFKRGLELNIINQETYNYYCNLINIFSSEGNGND